ncbi:unnamed protein product [Lampetra fluviatilis]
MMLQPFGLHVPVCGDGALAGRPCTSPDAAFGVDDIAGLFTGPLQHEQRHHRCSSIRLRAVHRHVRTAESSWEPFVLRATGLANEDDRKKRRRERNKIAAAKCRSKKKEKTETLAQESQRLEGYNSNLRSQFEAMLGEKQRLVQLINMHRPSCIVHASSTSPGVEPTHHSNAP